MSTMGLLGFRALAIDVHGVSAVFERMRAFQHAPHPPLAAVFLAADAIRLHGQGRGADVHSSLERALGRLEATKRPAWRFSRQERDDLVGGLLLTQGLNDAYRERSRSLAYAAKLERIGTAIAVASGLRVSMTYYLLRGDAERANHFRRMLDLKAIEHGSTWQVEWLAVPIEGLAAALWTDLLGMRRALDRLDRLVEQEPAFELMRDTIRIPYLFRRGDYAEVILYGEAFMRRHPPRTRIGWSVSYAMVALAYVELGQAERALQICEGALAEVTEADREYFVMYTPLEVAYAAALALRGDFAHADQILRARRARMTNSDEPLCIAVLYEYRIKIARMHGDRAELEQAIEELSAAAVISRNPGMVALAHRLCHVRPSRPEGLPPTRDKEEAAHTVSSYLAKVESLTERARQALSVLSHYIGSSEGYLYLDRADSLQLTAALDEHNPPDSLLPRLQLLAAANDTQSCTPLEDGLFAYRLPGGFAVLRAANTQGTQVPETLLTEIGDSLIPRAVTSQ
jgi:tetratricopeptide (TPR) repeat protein